MKNKPCYTSAIFFISFYHSAMFSSLHRHTDLGLLLLRFAVGAVFLYHGVMKWGMADANTVMTILKYVEPIGGAAIILGVLTQLAALGLAIIMVGAIYTKATGFYQAPFDLLGTFGNWEFDMMNLASCIVLFLTGAGAYSIDAKMFKKA
jgi:putative oxidoreductase